MGRRYIIKTRAVPGDWNAICDISGNRRKASELLENWKRQKVLEEEWEPRHPQDFVRTRTDNQAAPWTRSRGTDTFVSLTCASRTGIIGNMIIGCGIIGWTGDSNNNPSGTFVQDTGTVTKHTE